MIRNYKSPAKKWYQSKTFWVNFITLAGAVTAFIAGQDLIAEHPKISSALLAVSGVLNIGLRWLTNQPIEV